MEPLFQPPEKIPKEHNQAIEHQMDKINQAIFLYAEDCEKIYEKSFDLATKIFNFIQNEQKVPQEILDYLEENSLLSKKEVKQFIDQTQKSFTIHKIKYVIYFQLCLKAGFDVFYQKLPPSIFLIVDMTDLIEKYKMTHSIPKGERHHFTLSNMAFKQVDAFCSNAFFEAQREGTIATSICVMFIGFVSNIVYLSLDKNVVREEYEPKEEMTLH